MHCLSFVLLERRTVSPLSRSDSLSIIEEHQKQIETLRENEVMQQEEIERLIEERDRARELLSQRREEEEKKFQEEESNYQSQLRERDEQLELLYKQIQEQQERRPWKESESQTSLSEDRY